MRSTYHHWLLVAGWLAFAGAASAQPQAARLRVTLESAWLADPLTFPFSLRLAARERTLEVHGDVPTEAVRTRVLDLARAIYRGEVDDKLRVDSSAARTITPREPGRLQAALEERLRMMFPELAGNIDLQCDKSGRVLLNGAVPSWTEKRTVQQALRDVPGCTSLVNRLLVGAPPATGIVQVRAESRPNVLFAQPITDNQTEQMRAAVAHACPKAPQIAVTQVGPHRYQVEIEAPNDEVGARYAGRIFNLPEFRPVHVDVLIRIPR